MPFFKVHPFIDWLSGIGGLARVVGHTGVIIDTRVVLVAGVFSSSQSEQSSLHPQQLSIVISLVISLTMLMGAPIRLTHADAETRKGKEKIWVRIRFS